MTQEILNRKICLKRQALGLIRAEIRELKRARRRAWVKTVFMRVDWVFKFLRLQGV
jgi:hypothetical protein